MESSIPVGSLTHLVTGRSREVPKTNALRCIIIVHNRTTMHGTDVEDLTIGQAAVTRSKAY